MAEYNKVAITEAEKAIFDAEWDRLFTRHFRAREVNDVYEDHKTWILETLGIAKYQLEATFGGAFARTNEIGWSPILPNHLLATSTPTYATSTWNRYFDTADVVTRWKDWIGTSSSNLKLSKYGTMIIIGFADPVPDPKIEAVLAKVKSVDYPIFHFGDHLAETDHHIVELPSPIIVEKEQEVYFQTLVKKAGLDMLQPIGVMYGKGDWLRSKTAHAQV